MESIAQQTPNLESVINILQDQLQKFLTTIKEQTGVPGISLALNIGPQKITANAGTISIDSDIPMTENTHFQLGCISKLLTAMVAAELITAGKLDPDDPIEKYLEELRGTERGKDIQIWHLLSHTSGYLGLDITDPGVAYYYTWPKFMEYFKTAPQLFKPGTVFGYEHSEYVILGEIIKRITGNEITDLYNEMIINPLKLTTGSIKYGQRGDNAYAAEHKFNPESLQFEIIKSVPYGDFWNASLNNLTMNTRDILSIASVICGIIKTPSCISDNALKFVQKQVIKIPRTYGNSIHEEVPRAFGVGCAFYRGWLLGINGSARSQTCGLRFDPRSKIALAIGLNVWNPIIRDSIIYHIFSALRGQLIPPLPEEPFGFPLSDLDGSYIGPLDRQVIVKSVGDKIRCSLQTRNLPTMDIIMHKDDKGILRVQSDTQHLSIGFFHEPESGIDGLMLGPNAFRKQ
ncbi:MAG: beta-lactamase family protein [Bacteroidales bacterium]|nr:beta-lactamase family protein [Bacteroidales bacterium]